MGSPRLALISLCVHAALLSALTSPAATRASADRLADRERRERERRAYTHIPHIIHQSWKDANVPAGFLNWTESWRINHPTWEYRLWTDEDNKRLVLEHYPWFWDTFDALPKPVMKADSARYLYMHHHGGVYADLDFESLRPLDELLGEAAVALGAMTHDGEWDQNFPNAWLASVRGHPFWLFCVQQIIKAAGACSAQNTERWDWLEATTGPVMLHGALRAFTRAGQSGITVLPPGVIYPIDWRTTVWGPRDGPGDIHSICNPPHPRFNATYCKSHFPNAYAITYWTHTWAP